MIKYLDLKIKTKTMLKKLKEKYHSHRLHRAQKQEAKQQLIHQIKNAPSAYDDAAFAWIAPEYIAHERGMVWLVSVIVFVVGVAGIGLYYGNWSFSLVLVIFALVYSLVHLKHPHNVEIKISEIGIKVGFRKYSYSNIKAFWILYEPPYIETLNIRVSGTYTGDFTIQLGPEDPSKIREYLINKIPEMEGKSESITDSLARLFKL